MKFIETNKIFAIGDKKNPFYSNSVRANKNNPSHKPYDMQINIFFSSRLNSFLNNLFQSTK